MKIGGFGHIEDYEKIKAAGFDYAELDIPEIAELSDADFEALCKKVETVGFPVLSGSRALPVADIWFFTEQYSLETYREFIIRACARAKRLGITKIIIGNGKARRLIDENSWKLTGNFLELLRFYAQACAENGMEMILEPLGPDYSNYINTLPEAVNIVKEAGNENLFIMADMRHMVRGGESFEHIAECADFLHHFHIDNPETFPARPWPSVEDGYDYMPFLNAIKAIAPEGMLTVEADYPEDWSAAYAQAIKVLEVVK